MNKTILGGSAIAVTAFAAGLAVAQAVPQTCRCTATSTRACWWR
jgi:hypothetical protein